MKNSRTFFLTTVLSGLLTSALPVAADMLPGEAKAYGCIGCHGADGMKSAPGQPAIGGRPAEALLALLHDYRALRRINPPMQFLVLNMTEDDLENVAEYFSLIGSDQTGSRLR